MQRQVKLANRAAKLERTQLAFMEGVGRQLHTSTGTGLVNMNGEWRINFGPPGCSTLGPSRHQVRKRGVGTTHTVTVPESWLEDVYAPGIAAVDGVLILSAARCDHDGIVEAWKVVNMYSLGRKMRSSSGNFVVRFGGLTAWARTIETAFAEIQISIRRELGFAIELPF